MQTSSNAWRKSANQIPQSPSDCWVDIYEGPYLSGTLRRLKGADRYEIEGIVGSIIVGPGASILMVSSRDTVAFKPRQSRILADINDAGLIGRLIAIEVIAD